jgi:hypothetical protein
MTRALASAREAALRLMLDRILIERVNGSTFDQETGREVPDDPQIIYSGPARVVYAAVEALSEEVADAALTRIRATISVPIGAAGSQVHDRITVTESAVDPELVGRIFTVTGVPGGATSCRRLSAIEVIRGG